MFRKIQLNPNEKTFLEVKGTGQSLFLLNLDGNVVILPDVMQELKYKKGSISFRLNKGMKMRNAIKEIIAKSKPSKTEILILDLNK